MIVDRIYEWAKHQPDKTAVIWNDVSLSYLSFSNAIETARGFFQRENLSAGQTAIVLGRDILEAWVIVMALRSLGLNTISIPSIEIGEFLGIGDSEYLVATHLGATMLNPAPKAFTGVKVIGTPASLSSGNQANELPAAPRDKRPFGGHILYTSGTTGTHKKVMMRGDYEDRRNRARADFFSFDSNTVYHGTNFGLWTGVGFKFPPAIWHAGGCVVFDQSHDVYERFFSHGATIALVTPSGLEAMLRARGPSAGLVDGFAVSVGGGFLSIELAEQSIQKLTGNISSHYGLTEINSLPLLSRFRSKDDLLWLAPTSDRLIQIVDEDDRECPAGQEGKLRILLSEIDCHHYLDDEETTAKVFRDGFFYPGDMAVRREDGRIRILGRTADVVNLKGQKTAVAPIEQAIQRYLGVDDVCLFSGLTEQGHEEVIVAIQSDRTIQRSHLEAVARNFVRLDQVRFSIRKEFPRTETGLSKTNRTLLKKLVFEEIEADKAKREDPAR